MPSRAVWTGVIGFSLVSIPVKMYTATEEKRVSFNLVHREDGAKVRYKRVCEADGMELAPEDIAKGYVLDDGDVVVLTDEDLDSLPTSATRKVIEVEAFIPQEQIDPIFFTKSYYLVPEKLGRRPYALMHDALADSGRVAVVKFAMRDRETLAMLRAKDGMLVLESMLWPDEVKAADFDFLDTEVTPKTAELAMARTLIDTLSADWDPDAYHDTYRDAVHDVIEAKAAGHEVVTPPAAPAVGAGAEIVDIMAALKASVEAAKATRPESQGAAKKAAAKAAPAATAKKAEPAKKTAAKKTPARAAKGARGGATVTDLHAAKAARKKPAVKTTTPRRSA